MVDRQPHLTHQRIPLLLGALFASQIDHHDQIQLGLMEMRAGIGEHCFVDEKDGVGRHGGFDVCEDLAALGVGPVVHAVADVVEFGAWGGC